MSFELEAEIEKEEEAPSEFEVEVEVVIAVVANELGFGIFGGLYRIRLSFGSGLVLVCCPNPKPDLIQ